MQADFSLSPPVSLANDPNRYFEFVLEEDSELVVCWVACYLTPIQKLMLSSHQVKRVKQYL